METGVVDRPAGSDGCLAGWLACDLHFGRSGRGRGGRVVVKGEKVYSVLLAWYFVSFVF